MKGVEDPEESNALTSAVELPPRVDSNPVQSPSLLFAPTVNELLQLFNSERHGVEEQEGNDIDAIHGSLLHAPTPRELFALFTRENGRRVPASALETTPPTTTNREHSAVVGHGGEDSTLGNGPFAPAALGRPSSPPSEADIEVRQFFELRHPQDEGFVEDLDVTPRVSPTLLLLEDNTDSGPPSPFEEVADDEVLSFENMALENLGLDDEDADDNQHIHEDENFLLEIFRESILIARPFPLGRQPQPLRMSNVSSIHATDEDYDDHPMMQRRRSFVIMDTYSFV